MPESISPLCRRRALRAVRLPLPGVRLLGVPLLAVALLSVALLAVPQAATAGADPAGAAPASAAPANPPGSATASPALPDAGSAAAGAPGSASGNPASSGPASPAPAAPGAAPGGGTPAAAPGASTPGSGTHTTRHVGHTHRRAPAGAASGSAAQQSDSTDATVALTTQPGSALETTATQLVASDLRQSRSAGDPPVMLVGSARLGVKPGPAALFVQVQSADFCGSAGCSTSAYLKHGDGWTKVLDSISGPIKVSRRSHHGMYDLLVHGKDRWIWNGRAYADTLPSPDVDLLHSVRK